MLKEYLSELLAMQAPKEEIADNINYNIGDTTNGAMVAIRTLKSAKNGDVKALRLLYEVLGELDVKGKVTVEVLETEKTAAYESGYKQGQADVFEYMTVTEIKTLLERLEKDEKPKGENPLILPNGNRIYGESGLE